MVTFNNFVFFYLIPLCLYKFILNFNHLLVSLFSLEFISLSFFFVLTTNIYIYDLEFVFMLYFLVLVVCEGVLGLCMLVLMTYNYGSDYIFMFNKLMC